MTPRSASERQCYVVDEVRRAPPTWQQSALSGVDRQDTTESLFNERRGEREAFVLRTIKRKGVSDQRVLAAMCRVPRHRFVPCAAQQDAYRDFPLPIGMGQTTSQPYIVAYMLERVGIERTDRCLEIGTGCGYQTAVMAELAEDVFSIEYFTELADSASVVLRELSYRVSQRVGDGSEGWPEAGPFDAVVVSAAPETVPVPLLGQLSIGGRLIIPVGSQDPFQVLELWTRLVPGIGYSSFSRERLIDVRFVPFLGRWARCQGAQ